jgi:hypothetical protein
VFPLFSVGVLGQRPHLIIAQFPAGARIGWRISGDQSRSGAGQPCPGGGPLLCLARPGELLVVLVAVGPADGAGIPDAGGVDTGWVDAGADGAGRVAAVS